MMPPDIRAVVFDAVGTVIHPEPTAPVVYATIGQRHGSLLEPHTIVPRFRSAFQHEEALDRAAGWRTSEDRERQRWQRIVAGVLIDVPDKDACFRELFDHFSRPQAWQLDPDIAIVLAELADRKLVLSLASNYDRRLRTVIAGLPALAAAHHVVISSEVGWRKPASQFYTALCAQLRLAPTEVLFVGDDFTNDYVGAREAGLAALLYDPQGKARVPLQRIRRLVELLRPS
jgi:putative hydrolase of the HAD superfamily